jgi:hypothetical protein
MRLEHGHRFMPMPRPSETPTWVGPGSPGWGPRRGPGSPGGAVVKFEIGLSQRAYARRRGCDPSAVRKAIKTERIAAAVLPDGTINPDHADRLWEANTDPNQRRGREAERATASMAAVETGQSASPVEDNQPAEDADASPRPVPLRPEMFEEDPPRRRRRDDDDDEDDDDAKVLALTQHISANRARAAARGDTGPAPGVPSEASAELAESLLTLAVEEKREKVRKLRLANDEKEGTLVAKAQTWAHFYAVVAGISEAFQVWPDKVGPELAGKYGNDAFAFTQDLKEAVREQLKALSSRDARRRPAPGRTAEMLRVDPTKLAYPGAQELDAKLSEALAPALDLLVSQWADKSRVLSKKHAKEHGDWNTDRVPFAREIMDCFSARSPVQRVTYQKGAQVSGTESANNVTGYCIASAPAPVLYVSPTLTVTKRTSARIQAMIDDGPEGLGQRVMSARKRESKNSQFEKHFPGGALYFATANSASNLRSTAAKITIFDEVDAYPGDVGGEGGVIEVAEARGFTFGDQAKSFLISTPGVDQTSIIKKEYLKGDQRLYMMPCPHCRRRIDFHWGQFA